MTKLAHLIAEMEGFFKEGSIPALRHNPGDLRHSPHSEHPGDPNDIGHIATDEEGWEDLERQLQLFAERGLTLRQAINTFAPPNENDTENYLNFVSEGLGLSPDTPMSEVLTVDY